jgi:Fic family protein
MNETIVLTARQKEIVNIISKRDIVTRDGIAKALPAAFGASKATLARDIKDLLEKGLIKQMGSGPRTSYQAAISHPLLSYVDLGQYFAVEPDERKGIYTTFNKEIFSKIPGLINESEQKSLAKIFRSFNRVTTDMDKTILERELERYMIELSWKSSKIEGNTYTLLETESLIKQGIEAKGKTKHEATMILNHKEAFKLILKHRENFKTLTKRDLLELHNVLIKDLNITSGIRKHAVGITGTKYQPLTHKWELSEALDRLIDLVNNTNYPLEKSIILSTMIAYIQPFADGNKRTARMIANGLLLAHDYFPLSYRSVDENEFKQALIIFYEINNMYHAKSMFLDQYRFAIKNYFPQN